MTKHLAGCGVCRELADEIRRAAGEIRTLREMQPEQPHPEALTASVLRRIRLEGRPERSPLRASGLESVMDWVGTPFARGALFAVALLIVGLFAAQEALIVHRLDRLEQAVKSENSVTAGAGRSLSLEEAFRSLSKAASGGEWERGATLGPIRIDSLLREYQRLRRENDLLKRLILDQFPELNRYFAGKPVTAKQLETLLREYPEYINLLRRL